MNEKDQVSIGKNRRKENQKACQRCGRSLAKYGQRNFDGVEVCGRCYSELRITIQWGFED